MYHMLNIMLNLKNIIIFYAYPMAQIGKDFPRACVGVTKIS